MVNWNIILLQNDSSDNSGAEPETPQDDSQISSWDWFHNSRDSAEDSQESDTEPSLSPRIAINLGVMNARTSLNDTRRKGVLLYLSSRGRRDSQPMTGL